MDLQTQNPLRQIKTAIAVTNFGHGDLLYMVIMPKFQFVALFLAIPYSP